MIAYGMVWSLGKSNPFGYRTPVRESTEAPPRVVVYTREECCLCDEALEQVGLARREVPFSLEVIDVDRDPGLAKMYGEEVPVIVVDGRKAFKFRVTSSDLVRRLRRPRLWRTWRGHPTG
jgi:hypothetical protein